MTQHQNEAGLFSKPLTTLYITGFLSGVGVGMFNPLISVFLEQKNVDTTLIGLNASLFYLCIAIGAPLVERSLRQTGMSFTLSLGFTLTAISAILFPLQNTLSLWFILRILMGVGSAFYMIASQAAVNHFASDKNRALTNGIYGLIFSIGMGSSPVVGTILYTWDPFIAFATGGGLLISGIGIVWWGLPKDTATLIHPSTGLFQRISTPLFAIFAYGVAEAALLTTYPVFLARQAYSPEQIGWSLSAFIIGAILCILPLTHLGDRFGRLRLLKICVFVGTIATTLLIMSSQNIGLTILFSIIAGAGVGPMFVLSLALVGESLPKKDLPAGSALFTMAFSIGSTFSPWASSISMEFIGNQQVFTPTIFLFVLLLLYLFKPQRI